MKIPQLIVIAILAMGLGLSMAEAVHEEKPRTFFTSLISKVIWIALLAWGGFWE